MASSSKPSPPASAYEQRPPSAQVSKEGRDNSAFCSHPDEHTSALGLAGVKQAEKLIYAHGNISYAHRTLLLLSSTKIKQTHTCTHRLSVSQLSCCGARAAQATHPQLGGRARLHHWRWQDVYPSGEAFVQQRLP